MDELSPLFHDIEFKERFRGYDVEEVDAYIDRVAKSAALVQGRIAELQLRVEAAEAQPRTVAPTAPTADSAPIEADEASITRMLLMAQGTADRAIEEAQAEADQIRAQANDHASLVLAEAETDRRRMQVEAEAAVEQTVQAERERVTAEVAELEQYRAFLTDDIAILEAHLERSRDALQASVTALQNLVEAPEQFRAPAMPETSGVQLPAGLIDAEPVQTPAEVVAEPVELSEVAAEPVAVFEPILDDEPVAEPVAVVEDQPVFEPAADAAFDIEPQPEPVPDPVSEADVAPEPEPELSEPVPELALAAEPDPFEGAPQGSSVMWADDAAEVEAFTFDPGPMPAQAPRLAGEVEADYVDLTEEPIVLDDSATVDPIEPSFVVDEPVTGEWRDGDTGTSTAIAPPLLVTAADLTESEPEVDWIDDLRVDAGPATEPVPMVDDRLLFDEPEPTANSEAFLEQLRDAVSGESTEEFGEDALAAFFDDGEDDAGRTWFNRRR